MDRLGAGAAGRVDDGADVEVAVAGLRRADSDRDIRLGDVARSRVTDRMPMRRNVLITRTAISPRFATSTVSKEAMVTS
jgi:hypothetical protein